MTKDIKITVENRLIIEKRAMSVYHHASRGVHLINQNSFIVLPLLTILDHDYLHISIISGPGDLERMSIVNLPSWIDFDFLSDGNFSFSHSENRTLLKIPPGLPGWQLRLTRSPSQHRHSADRITISDE